MRPKNQQLHPLSLFCLHRLLKLAMTHKNTDSITKRAPFGWDTLLIPLHVIKLKSALERNRSVCIYFTVYIIESGIIQVMVHCAPITFPVFQYKYLPRIKVH